MLQPSANLAADDVTITCKVRRSQHALNPVFEGGLQEMTCTMRYWQSAENSSPTESRVRNGSGSDFALQLLGGDAVDKQDPELVLCSVQKPLGIYDGGLIKLSDRFESFGTNTPSLAGSNPGSRHGSNPGSRHPSVSRSRPNSVARSRNSSRARSRNRGRNPSAPRSRPSSRGRIRRGSAWSAEELRDGTGGHMRPLVPDEKPPEVKPFVIPLSDIVVVDTFGESKEPPKDAIFREKDRMNVTTMTNGYYEFYFQTRMSHDILLAFLRANLAAERIAEEVYRNIQQKVSSCCSEELFDAETLTAKRMEERVRKERLSERLRRKFTHLATRMSELSNNIADCACGGGGCQIGNDYITESPDDARRQSPPHFEIPEDLEFSPHQGSQHHLEMSDSNMPHTSTDVTPKQQSSSKPAGGPLDDVPGVEKISFEDESVSGDAEAREGAFI